MKNLKYFSFALILFMFITCSPEAITVGRKVINTSSDASGAVFFGTPVGDVTCTSSNEAIFTVTNAGIVTPVADGYAAVTCTDEAGSDTNAVVVNLNKKYTQPMLDKMTALESVTTLNLNFPVEFTTKTLPAGNGETFVYAEDALYFYLVNYLNGTTNSGFYPEGLTNNDWESATFKLGKSLYYDLGEGNGSGDISWTTDNSKTLNLSFKTYVEADANKVATAKSKVKDTYYVYLNDIYDEMFDDIDDINKMLADESDLQKDLGNDIFYELDGRRGDCSPDMPSFAGYIRLGTNETIYEVTDEVSFQKAIKIPTLKAGENIEEKIKKYFEDNIINSNEQVEIEFVEAMSPDAEDYYEATITPKDTLSMMGMIVNFLFPNLKAAEEKVVGFSVIQTDEVIQTNPKTNDNIYLYLSLTLAGFMIGLPLINKLKKEN